MMGRVVWILLVLLTIACVTPQDASIQQASPTVGHHKDPCHGGSKDTWGHTADVLWFCYNGSIDATFFVPASALTKQYGGWIGSASTWQGYPWYIEARPSPDYGGSTWGHVVATTEKHWSKNSFGFYKSDVKQMYSNLTYTNGKFSFHLNTTRKDFTPNQGQNCTQHQICAFVNGFDPCWQYAFCRIAPKINASTPIQPGVVVPAPVDSQAKEVLIVGKFQPIFHHPLGLDPDANTWYKSLLVILQAGQINESCYACTFFPQSISESMFVRPQPLSEREVQCMMCSLRNITKPRNSNDQLYSNWWRTNATRCDNCTQFDNLPIRANLSTGYKKDEALTRPLMVIPSDQIETTYPVCFTRANARSDNLYVGETSGCALNINATCGKVFNISKCNVTGTSDVVTWISDVYGPSDDGGLCTTTAVWLCGRNMYQALPPHWAGTCTLVYLSPTVTIHARLHHTTHHYAHYKPRSRRSALPALMTSEGEKLMAGTFPWWGTVKNAHNIDKLHVQLENLTSITSSGFSALGPFAAAVRNTLTQHQLALDIILASQGGLCHVIGDQCCTYIPDVAGNITETVTHLNNLLAQMKKDDVAPSIGWSFWDWLMSGSWREKLLTLVGPVIMLVVLCCLCSTCIMPCISRMMDRMLAAHVYTYMTLQQRDPDSPDGNYDSTREIHKRPWDDNSDSDDTSV